MRSVRYYWYDAHDKLSLRYRDFFKPDHRPCGVTGYKARDILREAFEIQAEINHAMGLRSIKRVQQDIIPNKDADAMPMSEIRKRYMQLKEKHLQKKD